MSNQMIKVIFIINMIVLGAKAFKHNKFCDNGKSNLTVDWDFSIHDHTCLSDPIKVNKDITHSKTCIQITREYKPKHYCMRDIIIYDTVVPSVGGSRLIGPEYGEYTYCPKQRWVRALQKGAIVALYHPCADPVEVKKLKDLVRNCLRRHIITPLRELDYKTINTNFRLGNSFLMKIGLQELKFRQDKNLWPMVLVSWKCIFTMSFVKDIRVQEFIAFNALQGVENDPANGAFNERLLVPAKEVSDINDSTVCPAFSNF